MKEMDGMKERRNRLAILMLALLVLVSLVSLLFLHVLRASPADTLEVVVQSKGQDILRVPLGSDAMYLLKDGTAEPVDMDATLASCSAAAQGDCNLLEIKDGEAWIAESNCKNQICVHTGHLSRSNYDFPITCLPHGLVVVIE